jgi:DNA-binding response OmpR family regulator
MARILLVDDEPDIRKLLAEALALKGHHVDVAASADEASSLAATESYEVAIIDYVLPGKRGLDLLKDLRVRQPFLRSIIISGQIDHDILNASDLEKQLQERIVADRYLPKPASIESLVNAIREVLEPSESGDWQKMAANAAASTKVKSKDVRELDKALRQAQKKPEK